MLCGLLKPTEGEGRVAGFDLRRDGAEARNRLGYMAQKFSLYGDLSVAPEPRLLRRGLWAVGAAQARAHRPDDGHLRLQGASRHVGQGSAAGPQAAPRAGLRGHARAAGALSRRTDLRRRSHHPPRVLDAYQRSGREGRDRARDDAFHGRGGILRPHLAHLSRSLDRARHRPTSSRRRSPTPENPDPTMEDAFIALVEASEPSEERAAA